MALANRGTAYERKRDMDHAIADYTEATHADPTFAKIYFDRALAYQSIGDVDRALADYDAAINLDPSDVFAFTNRGTIWLRKGEPAHAVDDFSQAIRLDRKHIQAYIDLAVTLFQQGDKAAALATVEDALRVEPRNRQLAEIRRQVQASGASAGPSPQKPSNEPASSTQGDDDKIDDRTLYTRVRTCLESGRYREGLRLAEILLQRKRTKFGADSVPYAQGLDITVRFHQALNQYKDIASDYEAQIAIYSRTQHPNNPNLLQIRGNLAQTYGDLSRFDEAQAIFNDVLAIQEATPGTEPYDLAWTLYNLAIIELRKANFSQIGELGQKSSVDLAAHGS